jgi:L-lactate dehydrogenase complex protein LldG
MEDSTTKEKILKNVRNALIAKEENPFSNIDFKSSVLHDFADDPAIVFVNKLQENGGNFVYCENEMDFTEKIKLLLKDKKWENIFSLDEKLISLLTGAGINVKHSEEEFNDQIAGITRCDFLIARFGSVMVSSALASGRKMFVFPETHIVFATMSQIVNELKDAIKGMKKKYPSKLPSQITVISGPSRTADIEKTLVMGAHGPKELVIFVVDDL